MSGQTILILFGVAFLCFFILALLKKKGQQKAFDFYKVYTPKGLQLVKKLEEMFDNNLTMNWGGEKKIYEQMFGKLPEPTNVPEEIKNFDKNNYKDKDEAAVKYLELIKKYNYGSEQMDTFEKLIGIDGYINEPEGTPKQIAGDYFLMLTTDLSLRHAAQYSPLQAIGETEAIEKYSLNIDSNEFIHQVINRADWFEEKTITTSYNYGGFQYRISGGHGFSYRMGNLSVVPNTTQQFTPIDRGTLYITNKRIIFVGTEKRVNKSIDVDDILEFSIFRDGVLIGKTNGKKPLIKFSEWIIQPNKAPNKRDDLNLFVRTLDRVLRKNQSETIPDDEV